MSGCVYVPKGWRWDRDIPARDRDAVLERVTLLPAWADNQLEAAHLDVKKLEGRDGLYRLRVGDHRAIFQTFRDNVIVHRVDRRDDVYEDHTLDALSLVRSGDGLRVLVEPEAPVESTNERRRPPIRKHAVRETLDNPLTVFANEELLAIGLSDEGVDLLRRLPAGVLPEEPLGRIGVDRELRVLVADMWERRDLYLDLLRRGIELTPDLARIDVSEAASRLEADESGTSLVAVRDAVAFAALLDAPIEDWMIYLHPAQRWAVGLSSGGPVRVRGGAGTGKTVVALHRARALAEQLDGKILLTTFVKTLPKVWDGLFQTFGAHVRDRIEMRNVDSLAMAIYRQGGGDRAPLEDGQRRALIAELYQSARGTLAGLSAYGLGEEFDFMLTGRGIQSLEDYLRLPRSGRGSPLPSSAREVVWDLYGRYLGELTKRRLIGWEEMRREALAMVLDGKVARRYGAVVVDEAQDLTETSLRLLVELAGGLPAPSLTIVGDGQQSIYPGGFSLRSLGVDIRGRSVVLRTNWRNTYGIWMAAQAFIEGEEFDDLEDEETLHRVAGETPYPLRDGDPARLHVVDGGPAGEAEWLAALVADDIAAGADPGDCAAFAPTNADVEAFEAALKRAGVPVAALGQYGGRHRERVWVGTFHRAKGLEFKEVYVAGISGDRWPRLYRNLDPAAREEERARQVRAAFVALTRARDHLDVVVSGVLPPPLERARWAFDE